MKLAEARTYAPLSFIGLVTAIDTMKKSPQKVYGMIAALHRTMTYIINPANRNEVVAVCFKLSQDRFGVGGKRPSRRRC